MHKNSDRCYTCRHRAEQARAEFWRDVIDFAGMAIGLLFLIGLTVIARGV